MTQNLLYYYLFFSQAQADQVESKAEIKDPDTGDIPNNLVLMPEMTKENLLDAVKTRFEADGQLHDL